jgi:hypothetical protein
MERGVKVTYYTTVHDLTPNPLSKREGAIYMLTIKHLILPSPRERGRG